MRGGTCKKATPNTDLRRWAHRTLDIPNNQHTSLRVDSICCGLIGDCFFFLLISELVFPAALINLPTIRNVRPPRANQISVGRSGGRSYAFVARRPEYPMTSERFGGSARSAWRPETPIAHSISPSLVSGKWSISRSGPVAPTVPHRPWRIADPSICGGGVRVIRLWYRLGNHTKVESRRLLSRCSTQLSYRPKHRQTEINSRIICPSVKNYTEYPTHLLVAK